MRELNSPGSERWLVAGCFAAAETDGVLLVMKSPIRDRDSSLWPRSPCFEMRVSGCELRACELEAPAWPSLAMPDFAAVGADGLVSSLRLRSLGTAERAVAASPGRSVPMDSPIRDLGAPRLELAAPLEIVIRSFLDMEPGAVLVASEPPTGDVTPELRRLLELLPPSLLELDTDGVLAVIELPIRDVMPGLIRPLELSPCSLLELDTDGVRVLVEPLIRKLGCAGLALTRGLGLIVLRLELSPRREFPNWPPVLVLSLPELEELGVADRPAARELEEGERTPIEAGARGAAGGLEVILPLLGAGETMLGLDDTDGLEFSVAPGLLRLDRFGLLGGRTDGELKLREEIPGLLAGDRLPMSRGAGATGRLTLAGGLALGAGAGAAACLVPEPALPEFDSFRSDFAATGSAANATIRRHNVKIDRMPLQYSNSPILIFEIRVLIGLPATAFGVLGAYFGANMIYLLSPAVAPRRGQPAILQIPLLYPLKAAVASPVTRILKQSPILPVP